MQLIKLLIPSLAIVSLIHISSCTGPQLTIDKQNYTSDQLRIDGYYYEKIDGKYYSLYFFYEDGTIIHAGDGYTEQELTEQEKEMTTEEWINAVKTYGTSYGRFIVDDDSIAFERWYPSSGGFSPVYLSSGKILNDTTFVITQSINSGRPNGWRDKNETYHFREFSPKPDSTNPYTQ